MRLPVRRCLSASLLVPVGDTHTGARDRINGLVERGPVTEG